MTQLISEQAFKALFPFKAISEEEVDGDYLMIILSILHKKHVVYADYLDSETHNHFSNQYKGDKCCRPCFMIERLCRHYINGALRLALKTN